MASVVSNHESSQNRSLNQPETVISETVLTVVALSQRSFGLCIFSLTERKCTLAQILDTSKFESLLYQVAVIQPTVAVADRFGISIVACTTTSIDPDQACSLIRQYAIPSPLPFLTQLQGKGSSSLAAFSTTYSYLQKSNQWSFNPGSIRFIYQTLENMLIIDPWTTHSLELVRSTSEYGKHTLYDVLNYTSTTMGAQLLRSTVLHPFTRLDSIRRRQDTVQLLLGHNRDMHKISDSLILIKNMDRVVSFLGIPSSKASMEDCVNNLVNVSDKQFEYFRNKIDSTINRDIGVEKTALGLRNQRCYAIKAGVCSQLDLARQVYKEIIEGIYDMAAVYREQTGIDIKLQFSNDLQFYLMVPVAKIVNVALPDQYINRVRKKKNLVFTTLDLLKKNRGLNQALEEIYLTSETTAKALWEEFRADLDLFMRVMKTVAELDLLVSFATYASKYETVRPVFLPRMVIKAGRHPIIDSASKTEVTPNDAYATLASSFQFVTGPNMAGKTTYLKQIALLIIMAYMGVPAEYAAFPPCTQILTRFTNENELASSSFLNEVERMKDILQNMTKTSILFIDEFGRSTDPNEASALVDAISNKLAKSFVWTYFATHFLHVVSRVLKNEPNVQTLQLTRPNGSREMHRIELGAMDEDRCYGMPIFTRLGYLRD
ncbi:hypothetical protein DM01DRAFT_322606 [Hesseltinella vesiculosa]|uniref:DNA mismatch repair proteins mutS family domain-containing protein n=1 Tax=Hesseltinella vesiculosa TaxID=101127 RepID=A0A1X2GDS6_9FUNG|nr:hypothetical protein DM01DRAFT_322606 [Hesseltinella vesiculosa]